MGSTKIQQKALHFIDYQSTFPMSGWNYAISITITCFWGFYYKTIGYTKAGLFQYTCRQLLSIEGPKPS